jgi:hypothetical protein
LNWPTKDPQDVLDYQVDITPAVLGNRGDAIAALSVSITPANPGDLTLNSMAVDGLSAVLWLSGGFAGTVYTVTLAISTTNGRSIQRSVLLPVLGLSSPAIPGNAIQTTTGVVITDQNGNPIVVY